MIIESNFKPAWWLTNPHAQTIYPTMMHRQQAPINHSERINLPDGDFIDLAWATNGLDANTPLVILLHGLGGSVNSVYVSSLLRALNQTGVRGVLMHFRGASEEPNRLPRAYHSGDTADFDFLINKLNREEPHTRKAAIGISLGGNVLLKWLGETGSQSLIHAAVAVSVPFQLNIVADRINQGFSRIYQYYLLQSLRNFFTRKLSQENFQLPYPHRSLASLKCFWTFDEYVTAPLHGFENVHTYYREASSKQYLHRITTPTLILHASDDPFMTPEILPKANELSESTILELSSHGGHVGFITGNIPGKPEYWLEKRIPQYLLHHLDLSKDDII